MTCTRSLLKQKDCEKSIKKILSPALVHPTPHANFLENLFFKTINKYCSLTVEI